MAELQCIASGLCRGERMRAWRSFVSVGVVAIVAGGLVAAAIAHEPSRDLVWLVAYLVLVVGVAQCGLGLGQAGLMASVPGRMRVGSEWTLFNCGNIAVIVGTLAGRFAIVAAGTAALLIALGLFVQATRSVDKTRLWQAYHGLLAVVAIGAVAGLGLSALKHAGA